MMKKSGFTYLLLAVITLIFIAGCGLLDSNDDNYIAGEVIASVDDHITVGFIKEYARIKKIGIRDAHFPETYLVRVGVDAGDIDDHAEALRVYDFVEGLNIWGNHEIRLRVVVSAAEEEVRSIISNHSGLSFKRAIRFQNLLVFVVPPGFEGRWVRRLSRETWVKHAERNQIVETR